MVGMRLGMAIEQGNGRVVMRGPSACMNGTDTESGYSRFGTGPLTPPQSLDSLNNGP